jgi:hypothetical protein
MEISTKQIRKKVNYGCAIENHEHIQAEQRAGRLKAYKICDNVVFINVYTSELSIALPNISRNKIDNADPHIKTDPQN